ncbi:hypothetical protein BaRGS_00001923, partial [Batillaria attramentaria]
MTSGNGTQPWKNATTPGITHNLGGSTRSRARHYQIWHKGQLGDGKNWHLSRLIKQKIHSRATSAIGSALPPTSAAATAQGPGSSVSGLCDYWHSNKILHHRRRPPFGRRGRFVYNQAENPLPQKIHSRATSAIGSALPPTSAAATAQGPGSSVSGLCDYWH